MNRIEPQIGKEISLEFDAMESKSNELLPAKETAMSF